MDDRPLKRVVCQAQFAESSRNFCLVEYLVTSTGIANIRDYPKINFRISHSITTSGNVYGQSAHQPKSEPF